MKSKMLQSSDMSFPVGLGPSNLTPPAIDACLPRRQDGKIEFGSESAVPCRECGKIGCKVRFRNGIVTDSLRGGLQGVTKPCQEIAG
jgi:hypothetical protein